MNQKLILKITDTENGLLSADIENPNPKNKVTIKNQLRKGHDEGGFIATDLLGADYEKTANLVGKLGKFVKNKNL